MKIRSVLPNDRSIIPHNCLYTWYIRPGPRPEVQSESRNCMIIETRMYDHFKTYVNRITQAVPMKIHLKKRGQQGEGADRAEDDEAEEDENDENDEEG